MGIHTELCHFRLAGSGVVGLSACHLIKGRLPPYVPVRTARAVPSKPRPGGAILRPTGIKVPRKFGAGKQQVSCPCTRPAVILAVGGWNRIQGVCRAQRTRLKVSGGRGTFL